MAYESKQSGDVHKSKTMQYNYQHFFRHDPMDRAKAYQYPPQPRKKARPTRYAPYPAIPDVPGDSISINANVPKNQPYFQSNRMFELTAKSTTNKFSSPLKPKTPSTKQCARNHAKSFKTELGSSYYAHLSNMHAYTRPINDSQSRTSAIRPINYLESAHTSRSHLPRSEGNTLNIHMPIPVSASLPLVLSIGKYDDDAVSEFPSLPSTSLGQCRHSETHNAPHYMSTQVCKQRAYLTQPTSAIPSPQLPLPVRDIYMLEILLVSAPG
jgi:hypothetical protein